MKMTYISRIRGNMKGQKTIYTTKATSRVIDGSYNSIYKGRSMNFDDLREYVPDDEIRDVDWKASARSRRLLVRQYIADKKHNIMLVMDTNKRMCANANDTDEKCDVALAAAGTLAYMVSSNGDYVSAVYNSGGGVRYYPFKTGLMNIENILAGYHRDTDMQNNTNISGALEFILKNLRRRMIILIVTDLEGIHDLPESTVRQLKVMNDVLLVGVADAGCYGSKVYSIESGDYLPDFFTRDKRAGRYERKRRRELEKNCEDKLKRLGISFVFVESENEMEERIASLLGKHKSEKQTRR